MFKKFLYYIVPALLFFQCLSFSARGQSSLLKLWYNKPAVKWTEALPIGNGRIGAMLFGGVEEDRLQFNEETLWTGEPRNYNRPNAYQYLDSIRQLLFAGRQKEAELLAGEKFMGLKSNEGQRTNWIATILSMKNVKGNPSLENYDDSQWKLMDIPSYDGWEAVGFDGLDGAVWLRTSFDLPANWAGKNLVLDLNRIRDQDISYVNGKQVGGMETTEPRKYRIAKDILHPGKNSIAILVVNFDNKGGITGYKDSSRKIGIYPEGEEGKNFISLHRSWKYWIQDDNPPPIGKYQADYQPFGDLWLKFTHKDPVTNYRRELDLSTALSSVSYSVNSIRYRREYLASQPHQVIAVHLTASKPGSISFEASLSSPHRNYTLKKTGSATLVLSLAVRNGALKGVSYLNVAVKKGSISASNEKIVIRNADEATVFVTAGTNFRNYKELGADPSAAGLITLKTISNKAYEIIRRDHIKEYTGYFNKLSIDLGPGASESLPTDERIHRFAAAHDPSFVALYLQYGRYLLIASSRPGTRPANLQGIWNDLLAPPWGSKYTTNINAEMNYWPAELLNLSAMHEPLFDMIRELSMTGRETAKAYYNAPGWVLHHNTDLWRGTAPINASNHGIWVTGGAWLCEHLWEHYQFTQDKNFLQNRAYPIMKQASQFFDVYLIKDPQTGWLISTPSNSPEQGGLVAGPTMDHQIIRSLFSNTIAAAEILGIDRSFREKLGDKIKQIAPNQVGKWGQLQEWLQDKDDTSNKHRHVSHLWGLHPGNEINWDDSPELTRAARQSLLYRGDAATGWSLGWKINLWARLKDGDHAFRLIQMLLSPASSGAGSYPNLFDAHPPFQIDGNFGGAAGIGELLVQSHTAYIDILPALPGALPDGEIKGICARGGFILDIKWKEGRLSSLNVLSKAGKALRLRYQGKTVSVPTIKNRNYRFDGSLNQL